MEFNPAYGTATKGDTTASTNTGPVAMQTNPAYGLTIKGKHMQSESETS